MLTYSQTYKKGKKKERKTRQLSTCKRQFSTLSQTYDTRFESLQNLRSCPVADIKRSQLFLDNCISLVLYHVVPD